MPPRFLLGASSVHPWCLLGSSLVPAGSMALLGCLVVPPGASCFPDASCMDTSLAQLTPLVLVLMSRKHMMYHRHSKIQNISTRHAQRSAQQNRAECVCNARYGMCIISFTSYHLHLKFVRITIRSLRGYELTFGLVPYFPSGDQTLVSFVSIPCI